MKVLLTGFESFQGVDVNPSQLVVEELANHEFDNIQLAPAILSVEYKESEEQLKQLIHYHQPDAVLMLGVAKDRDCINLERVAINVDDSEVPDNVGEVRNGHPIVWHTSPVAYLSTLPIMPMLEALHAKNITAKISNHAGTFICNHVFYVACDLYAHRNEYVPCGFIHVPAIDVCPLDVMVEGVKMCVELLYEMDA